MKRTLSALMLVLFVSCNDYHRTKRNNVIGMNCADTEMHSIIRCENEEVVCYQFYSQGMQIKIKIKQSEVKK